MFFFQAEDGIRDLVRSRGLGDVYKRQLVLMDLFMPVMDGFETIRRMRAHAEWKLLPVIAPVSYTHLTLPTSDLV